MDLNDISFDPTQLEAGAWVQDIPELGNIRIKTRGLGNTDWRRLAAKLSLAVPRSKKDGGGMITDPEERDRITTECLIQAGLIDWDGLTADGAPIPFSQAKARELLSDARFRRFRDGCIYAAGQVAEGFGDAAEAAEKN